MGRNWSARSDCNRSKWTTFHYQQVPSATSKLDHIWPGKFGAANSVCLLHAWSMCFSHLRVVSCKVGPQRNGCALFLLLLLLSACLLFARLVCGTSALCSLCLELALFGTDTLWSRQSLEQTLFGTLEQCGQTANCKLHTVCTGRA